MYELTTIRTTIISEGHEHIDLVGYMSPHIEEPISITPDRIPMRQILGESFGVRIGDELVEVKAAACPVCGHEPHLKTAKDTKQVQHLLALSQT